MATKTMTEMWALLDVYTLTANGSERDVNPQNEWGGCSKRLGMPVFTGWKDMTEYNKAAKTSKALVCDTDWGRAIGVNNQERWLTFAENSESGLSAFFVIHAVDEQAELRKVRYVGDDRVFVGTVVRDGTRAYVVGQSRPL